MASVSTININSLPSISTANKGSATYHIAESATRSSSRCLTSGRVLGSNSPSVSRLNPFALTDTLHRCVQTAHSYNTEYSWSWRVTVVIVFGPGAASPFTGGHWFLRPVEVRLSPAGVSPFDSPTSSIVTRFPLSKATPRISTPLASSQGILIVHYGFTFMVASYHKHFLS
jgi:hypothetical protein